MIFPWLAAAVLGLPAERLGLGAVVLTQARTIVKMSASEARRGRLLATYQLAITGGAPVGAVLMGYLSGLVGPRGAVLWPAGAMLLVLAFLLAGSSLWRQRAVGADDHSS